MYLIYIAAIGIAALILCMLPEHIRGLSGMLLAVGIVVVGVIRMRNRRSPKIRRIYKRKHNRYRRLTRVEYKSPCPKKYGGNDYSFITYSEYLKYNIACNTTDMITHMTNLRNTDSYRIQQIKNDSPKHTRTNEKNNTTPDYYKYVLHRNAFSGEIEAYANSLKIPYKSTNTHIFEHINIPKTQTNTHNWDRLIKSAENINSCIADIIQHITDNTTNITIMIKMNLWQYLLYAIIKYHAAELLNDITTINTRQQSIRDKIHTFISLFTAHVPIDDSIVEKHLSTWKPIGTPLTVLTDASFNTTPKATPVFIVNRVNRILKYMHSYADCIEKQKADKISIDNTIKEDETKQQLEAQANSEKHTQTITTTEKALRDGVKNCRAVETEIKKLESDKKTLDAEIKKATNDINHKITDHIDKMKTSIDYLRSLHTTSNNPLQKPNMHVTKVPDEKLLKDLEQDYDDLLKMHKTNSKERVTIGKQYDTKVKEFKTKLKHYYNSDTNDSTGTNLILDNAFANNTLSNDIADANKIIDDKQKEVDDLTTAIKDKQKEVDDLTTAIKDKQQELTSHKSDGLLLKNKFDNLKNTELTSAGIVASVPVTDKFKPPVEIENIMRHVQLIIIVPKFIECYKKQKDTISAQQILDIFNNTTKKPMLMCMYDILVDYFKNAINKLGTLPEPAQQPPPPKKKLPGQRFPFSAPSNKTQRTEKEIAAIEAMTLKRKADAEKHAAEQIKINEKKDAVEKANRLVSEVNNQKRNEEALKKAADAGKKKINNSGLIAAKNSEHLGGSVFGGYPAEFDTPYAAALKKYEPSTVTINRTQQSRTYAAPTLLDNIPWPKIIDSATDAKVLFSYVRAYLWPMLTYVWFTLVITDSNKASYTITDATIVSYYAFDKSRADTLLGAAKNLNLPIDTPGSKESPEPLAEQLAEQLAAEQCRGINKAINYKQPTI